MLAHLIDRPIELDAPRRLVRFREVPADLVAHLETWDRSFFTLGRDARAGAGGLYALDNAAAGALAPAAPHFAGRVWVLVDAADSSATFRFAASRSGRAWRRWSASQRVAAGAAAPAAPSSSCSCRDRASRSMSR